KSELRIWDVQTGAQITSVAGVRAGGESFRWSRDGKWMALIGPSVTEAPTFNITNSINSPSGKFTYEESNQYASLWEIANSCPRYLIRHPIKELGFRADGS